LDSSTTPLAVDKFKRAIELDPGYAPPYVGLANALFWPYEQTRYRVDGQSALLDQARCAQRIDGLVGEAHATLGYLLAAAERFDEARAAALRALALEPNRWEHHFRLANAIWGEERLRALQRCCELYAEFPFEYFQIAMVHVARREFPIAERALSGGIAIQER
jgi:tetratricopeptide (TPR) repeat protein